MLRGPSHRAWLVGLWPNCKFLIAPADAIAGDDADTLSPALCACSFSAWGAGHEACSAAQVKQHTRGNACIWGLSCNTIKLGYHQPQALLQLSSLWTLLVVDTQWGSLTFSNLPILPLQAHASKHWGQHHWWLRHTALLPALLWCAQAWAVDEAGEGHKGGECSWAPRNWQRRFASLRALFWLAFAASVLSVSSMLHLVHGCSGYDTWMHP